MWTKGTRHSFKPRCGISRSKSRWPWICNGVGIVSNKRWKWWTWPIGNSMCPLACSPLAIVTTRFAAPRRSGKADIRFPPNDSYEILFIRMMFLLFKRPLPKRLPHPTAVGCMCWSIVGCNGIPARCGIFWCIIGSSVTRPDVRFEVGVPIRM